MEEEMVLFEELKLKKIAGEKLVFENLSKKILEQLYSKEFVSDNAIARLYDVPTETIVLKRKEWGIN